MTPRKPCHRPQGPKGTFPGTPAASRDQRPWMAAGRRPSWGVPRSSWGLSPWQNPPEPTGTAASRSGPNSGVDWRGRLLVGDRGAPAVAPRGPAWPLHQSQMLGGHEEPQDILHGTAWHHCQGLWARRGTVLPAKTPQALAAFSQVCQQAQEGSWGGKLCLQATNGHTETRPHPPWGTARCK